MSQRPGVGRDAQAVDGSDGAQHEPAALERAAPRQRQRPDPPELGQRSRRHPLAYPAPQQPVALGVLPGRGGVERVAVLDRSGRLADEAFADDRAHGVLHPQLGLVRGTTLDAEHQHVGPGQPQQLRALDVPPVGRLPEGPGATPAACVVRRVMVDAARNAEKQVPPLVVLPDEGIAGEAGTTRTRAASQQGDRVGLPVLEAVVTRVSPADLLEPVGVGVAGHAGVEGGRQVVDEPNAARPAAVTVRAGPGR